jgi:hypothetical protein
MHGIQRGPSGIRAARGHAAFIHHAQQSTSPMEWLAGHVYR